MLPTPVVRPNRCREPGNSHHSLPSQRLRVTSQQLSRQARTVTRDPRQPCQSTLRIPSYSSGLKFNEQLCARKLKSLLQRGASLSTRCASCFRPSGPEAHHKPWVTRTRAFICGSSRRAVASKADKFQPRNLTRWQNAEFDRLYDESGSELDLVKPSPRRDVTALANNPTQPV